MRLIDADAIDFSEIKDPFDRARAEIIIKGCPTVSAGYRRLNFYDKLSIINGFHEWCEENIEEKTPAAMLEYLNYRGMLIR